MDRIPVNDVIDGSLWWRLRVLLMACAWVGCSAEPGSTGDAGNASDVSGAGDGASCNSVTRMGSTVARACVDYVGLPSHKARSLPVACSGGTDASVEDPDASFASSRTFSPTSLCDRTGTDGGCRFSMGSYVRTTWYFGLAPNVRARAPSTCVQEGGTWIR
jgi:hypothetical protein